MEKPENLYLAMIESGRAIDLQDAIRIDSEARQAKEDARHAKFEADLALKRKQSDANLRCMKCIYHDKCGYQMRQK